MLYVKVHCYLATKPEVEGFRDQGSVLPKVEIKTLEFKVFGFLNLKALPSREESDISLSIVNRKARFCTHSFRAYY